MISYIFENLRIIFHILTALVTLAAAIAVVTPSKTDDKILNAILDVINALALNVGKAKNADLVMSNAQELKLFRSQSRKKLHTKHIVKINSQSSAKK